MEQTAVFVDAGYLHAQGSALLAGQKQPRHLITLHVETVLRHLRDLAERCAPEARLLRIYWYDGLLRTGRMSSEQEQVGGAQFTKLRLGVVNSNGDQKGVDSLIVTDLIDLARNRAISDAVLLSGDEDIRVGVQIAQTFGVRIHLVGIKPARGSQSPDLIREADTHHEWDEAIVAGILAVRASVSEVEPLPKQITDVASAPETSEVSVFDRSVLQAIEETIGVLDQATVDAALRAFSINPTGIPPELDRPTLGRLKFILGRELSEDERKSYRAKFRSELGKL